MPKLEQMLIVDREERPLERREHRQLVVRPLDGREGRAHRLHFLAAVKRLAAHQQMRDATRFDRVGVAARHVASETDEPAEEHGDVARLQWYAPLAAVG